MATTASSSRLPAPASRGVGAYDRPFYGAMAIAMAAAVFAGFAPTYYLRLFSGGPRATVSGSPFTALVHAHAALFTAWVLLFIVQTALIASRRVAVHRRLGIAGAVLATAMVVVGTSQAIASAAIGSGPPGIPPLSFLAIPLFDMALFSVFVVSALVRRQDRESHKRLMVLAYVSLLGAAMARLPGVLPFGPFAFYGLSFVFVLVAATYDFVSRGRVHPVYLWGGALFAVSVPVRLVVSGTGPWLAFARAVTG